MSDGTVSISGTVGVMRQFIGGPQAKGTTVRDLLLSVSPQRIQDAARCERCISTPSHSR